MAGVGIAVAVCWSAGANSGVWRNGQHQEIPNNCRDDCHCTDEQDCRKPLHLVMVEHQG